MRTLELTRVVEKAMNEMVLHSISIERQNATLKKVIRVLASSVEVTEDGRSEMILTQEQADFIQKSCDELRVFD